MYWQDAFPVEAVCGNKNWFYNFPRVTEYSNLTTQAFANGVKASQQGVIYVRKDNIKRKIVISNEIWKKMKNLAWKWKTSFPTNTRLSEIQREKR